MDFRNHAASAMLFAAIGAFSIGGANAGPTRTSEYDGAWHLTFATQSGQCDATYEFDVNISKGTITEPNLVKFRGRVTPAGAVRASVTVQDKSASGSGRLAGGSGGGTWSGRAGDGRCSGSWTARRS